MYDANGQIAQPGILSGNVNMYGDFRECLTIGDEDDSPFQGKHCFAELQPFVAESATYLSHLRKLAQSYDIMQSTFADVSLSRDGLCREKSIIFNVFTFAARPCVW